MDGGDLGELVGRVLGEAEWNIDLAAERLMHRLGDSATCIAALDCLADLAEEAHRLTGRPERASALLRLRVAYRHNAAER
jgi:hypothetical protein